MKQVPKVAALAVVLVVIFAGALVARQLGWWGGKTAAHVPATAGSATTPPPTGPVTPAADPGASAAPDRAVVARDDNPRGDLRLEGIVLDADERGVGGALVAIDSVPPRTVTSGSDGAFAFDGLIARDYRLEAAAGERYAGPVRLRLSAAPSLVTLRLVAGATVEVVVVEVVSRTPVTGAAVELRGTLVWTATTGADGVATLRGVGPTWGTLHAVAAGFAPARTMVSTGDDPASKARFELAVARGAPVTGRVVDDVGATVAGARVVAVAASEPFPVVDARRDGVTSAADGTFTIPALAAGTYRLSASDGSHAPASTTPFVVDGTNPRGGLVVVLGAGGVIRGTVKTAAGAPVAGADVRVVVRGSVFWRPRRQAYSGADGAFVIDGLPRRELDVVAWHPDGASAIVPADLAAARERTVALVLDVVGAIDGVVVDRAGEPVGDAQVVAQPVWSGGTADQQAWSVRGVQEVLTDADGRFRVSGLPAGDYRVRAARPDAGEEALWTAAATIAKPGGPPLRLVLADDGSVTGKVAFAHGGVPSQVTVALAGGSGRPSGRTDGTFDVPAIGGTHVVVISGMDFVPAVKRGVIVEDGKATDLGTITVEAGRSVSGRVLTGGGAPVAGARVAAGTLLTGGGAELYIETESLGARSAETDAEGRFLITGFGPRALTVLAGKEGLGRSPSQAIPRGPDSVVLDLVLAPVGSLAGTVTQSGKPLADTVIIANPAGATLSNFFVVTGADGSFALDALAPGPYLVYPMIGGGGPRPKDMYMRRVEIVAGERATVTIDATPGPARLDIEVVTDAGGPVAVANVVVVQAKVDATNIAMLRDGSWVPPELVAGGTLAFHMRAAIGGPVAVEGARPGTYTACAVPLPVKSPAEAMSMMADIESLPMKCVPVTIAAAPVRATITVPAAWTVPKAP